jgi:hypothetical protein
VNNQFVRNSGVEMAPMKDETVLFNPANKKFCVLNPTAALIWNILEEPRTIPEIVAAIREQFDAVDSSRVEEDVRRALNELRLIECVRNSG